MKTKLLKKIRKQYSIVYYPNIKTANKYVVEYETKMSMSDIHGLFSNKLHDTFYTLQEAKDALLYEFSNIHYKYTRQYKLDQIKEKVWYK